MSLRRGIRTIAVIGSLLALATGALSGCAAHPAPAGDGADGPAASSRASTPADATAMHAGMTGPCPAEFDPVAPPERIVTLDGSAAAFLVELGLGDKIVGTAGTDFITDFDGELRTELDALPVIDDGQGNQEAVLRAEPDLVTGVSAYEFGGLTGTATVDTLEANGIAALAACGARASGVSTDLGAMSTYLRELAGAFGVPERAEALIETLDIRVEKARPTEVGADALSPVPTLVLMGAPGDGQGIRTRGGTSYVNALVALAGGENIAAAEQGDAVELSAEEVARVDPRLIVVVSGFGTRTPEQLVAAVLASPLLASTDAVHDGAVIAIPQRTLLSPSLLNVDAIEAIAAAVDASRASR